MFKIFSFFFFTFSIQLLNGAYFSLFYFRLVFIQCHQEFNPIKKFLKPKDWIKSQTELMAARVVTNGLLHVNKVAGIFQESFFPIKSVIKKEGIRLIAQLNITAIHLTNQCSSNNLHFNLHCTKNGVLCIIRVLFYFLFFLLNYIRRIKRPYLCSIWFQF